MESEKYALVFEADREAYGMGQLDEPITVGELKRLLRDFNDEDLIILSHDRGYTYGSIHEWNMREMCMDKSGEWTEVY